MQNYEFKKSFTLERDFLSAFLKNIKDDWGWWYKISDVWFTIKPFDCVFINQEWIFVCEAKIIENDIFDIKKMRSNQFTALKRISKIIEKYNLKNIHAVVLIYSTWLKKYKMINFSKILEQYELGNIKTNIIFD